MSDQAFLARFYAIIVLGCVLAGATGAMGSYVLYEIIKDPSPSTEWFPNFGNALLAGFIALVACYALYLFGTLFAARRLLSDRYSRVNYARIALVPVLIFALYAASFVLPGSIAISQLILPLAIPALVAIAVVPVGRPYLPLLIVGGVLVAYTAVGLFENSRTENGYDQERLQATELWDGPLVLTDGKSGQFMPDGWEADYIETPMSNDEWSSASLSNQRDGAELASIRMFNTSTNESVCLDATPCELVGQTKFGPMYTWSFGFSYVVDVPGGRIELMLPEGTDAVAIVDSLELVDAETFAEAAQEFN